MTPKPPSLVPPRQLFSGWDCEALDLDAYRERVGYAEALAPDADTLIGVHRAQATHIPFENLDIVLGRDIALDLESLQDKLVRGGRGGYCYEANLLLAAVLEHAGFTVTGTLARVRMGSGQLRPTTHAALVVHTDDGDPWLADVGFGGKAGLLEPVRLADGNESAQDGWRFRVDLTADGSWILSIADGDDWLDVYSFTTQPSYPADFDIANYSASTSDRSPFTGRLIAQLTGKRTRATLLDTELTVTHADGGDEVTDYEAAELPRLLTERFGIALSENELTEITRTVSGYAR